MKDTYIIHCGDQSVELKRSLFTCSMIAMDASDRCMCEVELIDGNTG